MRINKWGGLLGIDSRDLDEDGKLVIPESVTAILSICDFIGHLGDASEVGRKLHAVQIPECVKKVSDKAFLGCREIVELNIVSAQTELEYTYIPGLRRVTIEGQEINLFQNDTYIHGIVIKDNKALLDVGSYGYAHSQEDQFYYLLFNKDDQTIDYMKFDKEQVEREVLRLNGDEMKWPPMENEVIQYFFSEDFDPQMATSVQLLPNEPHVLEEGDQDVLN